MPCRMMELVWGLGSWGWSLLGLRCGRMNMAGAVLQRLSFFCLWWENGWWCCCCGVKLMDCISDDCGGDGGGGCCCRVAMSLKDLEEVKGCKFWRLIRRKGSVFSIDEKKNRTWNWTRKKKINDEIWCLVLCVWILKCFGNSVINLVLSWVLCGPMPRVLIVIVGGFSSHHRQQVIPSKSYTSSVQSPFFFQAVKYFKSWVRWYTKGKTQFFVEKVQCCLFRNFPQFILIFFFAGVSTQIMYILCIVLINWV